MEDKSLHMEDWKNLIKGAKTLSALKLIAYRMMSEMSNLRSELKNKKRSVEEEYINIKKELKDFENRVNKLKENLDEVIDQ